MSSRELRERVIAARIRAAERWGDHYINSDVPDALLDDHPLPATALRPVHSQLRAGVLSARGLSRTIRVAWTLADLAGQSVPSTREVATALQLRRPLDDL